MKVIDCISRGGFGRVEKIELPGGEAVARKVFDPLPEIAQATDLEKLRRRFRREVRVQRSLPGDFFVPLFDFDLASDTPWFSMPLCDKNYAAQIQADRKKGAVSQDALADILNALEELHALGYTHRDLKPQNILLHEGRWKLSDFGLVLPPAGETSKLTSTDSAWGTQLYCAPEQAQDFGSTTFAADIYAFGCILHDLFANGFRVPYQQHTCEGPLGVIIEKCTEFNPRKRFKSVAAVRGVLFSILAQPVTAGPSTEAREWVDNLEQASQWDIRVLYDLARYVRTQTDAGDQWLIFQALDEDKLRHLQTIDAEIWEAVALRYSEWAGETDFGFEYCDVVVRRLECLFEIGSLACKAAALIAAARMGAAHNRWFVMRRLLAICGPTLDERVARRLAIEIAVEEVQADFINSALLIGQDADAFHPLIAEVLKKVLMVDIWTDI